MNTKIIIDTISILIIGLAILSPPFICYIIARNENRHTIRWLFYGLIFGVFAIFYLVFYAKKKNQDKIEHRTMFLLAIFMFVGLLGLYITYKAFYP